MSRLVMLSMRDMYLSDRDEMRDCLETAWWPFLAACDLAPVCLPNDPGLAGELLDQIDVAGLILTGGGAISGSTGQCGLRDQVEAIALERMIETKLPVVGVCRGLQKLCTSFGGTLRTIAGHVRTSHPVSGPSAMRIVNSFHDYQIDCMPGGFDVKGRADDGSIEWIEDPHRRLVGIMWHPERTVTIDASDVELFKSCF